MVISISAKWGAGLCVYHMFVIQHSYKAATQQQYPLSPETYSDSASVRPSWQPDVGVYSGVSFSQKDRAWIVCSKLFDQGIGEDIPQSSSSSSVIPCMVSCTGTSCCSNSGQGGRHQSQHQTSELYSTAYIYCKLLREIRQFFRFKEHKIYKSLKKSYKVLQEARRILRMLVFMSEEQIT